MTAQRCVGVFENGPCGYRAEPSSLDRQDAIKSSLAARPRKVNTPKREMKGTNRIRAIGSLSQEAAGISSQVSGVARVLECSLQPLEVGSLDGRQGQRTGVSGSSSPISSSDFGEWTEDPCSHLSVFVQDATLYRNLAKALSTFLHGAHARADRGMRTCTYMHKQKRAYCATIHTSVPSLFPSTFMLMLIQENRVG